MGKKTSKHIRAAAVKAERHNRREKHLDHPRPELQLEDKAKWIWEAEDKKNIFRKLHVNTAYEATKYAVRSGLIDPSEFYI